MKDTRSRAWSFIVYPESAPEAWRDILDDLHLEWVESPLHQYDTDPTGEVKKAHWHILVQFTNVKSYEQVNEICKLVNAPAPQRCHNTRSLVRYFCHLDNPEKFQYNPDDIQAHGGADVQDLLAPSHAARQTYIAEMQEFIVDQGITEYQDLADYARVNRRNDWFVVLNDSGSLPIVLYLKSARHRQNERKYSDAD